MIIKFIISTFGSLLRVIFRSQLNTLVLGLSMNQADNRNAAVRKFLTDCQNNCNDLDDLCKSACFSQIFSDDYFWN